MDTIAPRRLRPYSVTMRPEILYPLFAPVTSLPGIGPRMARPLARLAGEKVVDLLWHLPANLIDRRPGPDIAAATANGRGDGDYVTLILDIREHRRGGGRRSPYRILARDGQDVPVTLVFFHARPAYLQQRFPEGAKLAVSGRLERFGEDWQITHPDRVVPAAKRDDIAIVEAVYPVTAGLHQAGLRKAIRAALSLVPPMPEWQDRAWLNKQGWMPFADSLRAAHNPRSSADLDPQNPAHRRLAYDELLAEQLTLQIARRKWRHLPGRIVPSGGRLYQGLRKSLPYALTGDQQRALEEIAADMGSGQRMLRLLQGDVGCGKTVIAALAAAMTADAGAQVALMAPTEILARQHLQTLQTLFNGLPCRIALLTGKLPKGEREAIRRQMENGEVDIVIGTHALFQKDIAFADLGLLIVDEQHRFGVAQRLQLAEKSRSGGAHTLVMTATPIPRTLALTAYGDMDISRIREKPPGRTPVTTSTVPRDRIDEVIAAIGRKMAAGEQIYWVCPLIEEEKDTPPAENAGEREMAAATARFEALRRHFAAEGTRIGLLHGRMKSEEKEEILTAFAVGKIGCLVATTVVEVGIDVANATVIVIEQAERFGLAQLHQLRGRVGRGHKPGHCILLYTPPLSETARARLKTMRETDDGFLIAERDLQIRGAGEVLGTRQSGMPEFRLADPAEDGDLIEAAHDDARLILERDGELQSERGRALRLLLYLFEQDNAIRTLRSG